MNERRVARLILAMTLDERGFHYEADNVRNAYDLESYEGELQAIQCILRWGMIERIPEGEEYLSDER